VSVKVVDSSSGEIVIDKEAHEGAIWSLSLLPPDGEGFMTGGADKIVKFWDFTVRALGGGWGMYVCGVYVCVSSIICIILDYDLSTASVLFVCVLGGRWCPRAVSLQTADDDS
jgi:WD40 repeat protein